MGQCAIYLLKLLVSDLSTLSIVNLLEGFNKRSCGWKTYSLKTINEFLRFPKNILNIFSLKLWNVSSSES